MTLRARLALGIFVIGLLLVVPLLLATQAMERIGDQTEDLRAKDFVAGTLLGQLRLASEDFSNAELALNVDGAPAFAFPRVVATLDRLLQLARSLPDVGLGDGMPPIVEATGELRRLSELELQARLAGETARAESLSADSIPQVQQQLLQTLRGLEDRVARRTSQRVDSTAVLIGESRDRTALAFILAAAMAVVIAALLTWSIGRPVRALEEGMARVADGEFDHALRIPETRNDEFGRLAQSFATMTRQLTELDKLKAEFVSVASHELKTPINVITGYVQLLEDGVFGPVPDQQREVLGTIGRQAGSLTRLVRQLLDISRFEAGAGKIEPRPFPLWEFMRELERAFQVLAHQREVQFRITRADDVPDRVTWDYDRMNEVLGNLLSNAFKFTPRGGRVELAIDAAGDRVLLEVKDSGAGIAAEHLPRIFDKFYQADNQASASAKGTGLGLAIAKSIVEAHGGTITCESNPGVGTTFIIDLPAVALRRALSPRTSTHAQPSLPGPTK
jgi:signal transduction histidine kinase